MAKKFYAVKTGRTPGVYGTWADCKAQVDGYSGAVYKSFPTAAEALASLVSDEELNADYILPYAVIAAGPGNFLMAL